MATAAASEYEQYLRREWELFSRDPSRFTTAAQLTAGVTVGRVLDVGCGSGQELQPFVARGASGVGIDIAPESGIVGRALYRETAPGADVTFVRGVAEQLPFPASSFDVVICRVVLPYTDNVHALAEIARVLRPQGVLLLRIHHARYYTRKLWQGLRSGAALSAVHAGRVLAAGVIYHATGRQVRGRFPSRETFQTRWLLGRELGKHGLAIVRETADSNPYTPSFLIGRR
jgi:SAM-dependent methyltransferase